MRNRLLLLLILGATIFFVGCEDIKFTNTSDSDDTESGNKAPIANAGGDRATAIFQAISIIGSGSDSDGQIVDYEWRENLQLISGLKNFTYLPTEEGNHTLTLTVVDNDGALGKDSMIVFVSAEANTSN
jgi:hypothetical protein